MQFKGYFASRYYQQYRVEVTSWIACGRLGGDVTRVGEVRVKPTTLRDANHQSLPVFPAYSEEKGNTQDYASTAHTSTARNKARDRTK